MVIPIQETQQTVGRGVGQCGVSECHEKSCYNGGVCVEYPGRLLCFCQYGWVGTQCTLMDKGYRLME